jgi:putative oxidoreductase
VAHSAWTGCWPAHACHGGNDGLGWGVSLIALLLPVAALLPGIGFGGALLGGVLLLGYLLRRRRAA